MRLLKSAACGLVLCTVLGGPALAVEPDAPEQLITRFDAVGLEVQKRLSASFRVNSETEFEKNEHGAMVEYYADHVTSPIWVNSNGLTDKARALIKELSRADDYGLKSSDYAIPELEQASDGQKIPPATLAKAEVALSHAALAYARDARGGRIVPGSLSNSLDPVLELRDPLELMDKFATLDDPSPYLRDQHPKHPQFEALRKVLLQMRGGTEEKLVTVPDGPIIRPGEKHAQVAVIRERLKLPAKSGDDAKLYDAELETAVKEFQKSRGLNAEGIVGPATRRAMNSRPKNRARTILANMERLRWLSYDKTRDLNVQVNIPEFRVRVLEGEEQVHTERVVVGKVKNPTPVFSDVMERIVFNPYWNVPNSIKVQEILPNLRRRSSRPSSGFGFFDNIVSTQGNPRWMARNNLRIKYRGKIVDSTQVDWRNVDIKKFHFYQPPGGPNVLGVVKFVFPNKHTVYMHDTTSKHLFAKSVRAESHGCMRVRDPLRLAEVLLKRESGWTRGRINKAVANKANRPVKLEKPVPVHITYFTARVGDDGSVRYFGDIYGHDAKMARALGL